MKKILLPALLMMSWIGVIKVSSAQYCIPPSYLSGPYTGITKVTFNTLSNSSADTDGYTDYTGSVSPTTVNIGQTYALDVDVKHTLMGTFSGKLNVRVWIDWNADGDFNDMGEEVLSIDGLQCQGSGSTGTAVASVNVTVPAGANVGTTRMRVYEDMLVSEGHQAPDPCGYSSGIGQHGECEDYNITVAASTSISEHDGVAINKVVANYYSNQLMVNYEITENTDVQIEVVDLTGKVVASEQKKRLSNGKYVTLINLSNLPSQGMYIVVLRTAHGVLSEKFIKQ